MKRSDKSLSRHLLWGALPLALLSAVACNRPMAGNGAGTEPARIQQACEGDKTVAAMVGGQPITIGDLDKKAGTKIFEARQEALEALINDRVLEPEAKKANLTPELFVRKQVEARVPDASEADARKFYDENKARIPQFKDKTYEEMKPMIVQYLTGQKRQEAVSAVIEEIKQKAGVKVMLQPPRMQVAATGPAKGPEGAKVTIVEFSDFQCPYCSRGRQVMDQVTKTYGDKVRVVFRDFPLDFHKNAQKAAEAGQCANEQGKFWTLHDWMFDHQDKLAVDDLKAAARELKLDGAKFDECLTSGKFAQAVADNMKAGQAAGVRGTPAFFVNGVFLNGALPFEKFKTEIDRELGQ